MTQTGQGQRDEYAACLRPGKPRVGVSRQFILIVEQCHFMATLEQALRSGHLAAAGVDVLKVEPMVKPPPMVALDSLIVTPHVAASTAEGLRRMAMDAAGNVVDYFAGDFDRDAIVNVEILQAPKR